MMRLGAELQALGHRVECLTTTATTLWQPDRWRVAWEVEGPNAWWRPTRRETLDVKTGAEQQRLAVWRMPIGPRLAGAGVGALLQRHWENQEEWKCRYLERWRFSCLDPEEPPVLDTASALVSPFTNSSQTFELGPGWQLPEFSGGICQRWSIAKSSVVAPKGNSSGTIRVTAYSLRRQQIHLEVAPSRRTEESVRAEPIGLADSAPVEGSFQRSWRIPAFSAGRCPSLVYLASPGAASPPGESRVLGVLVQRMEWLPDEGNAEDIPLSETFTPWQEFKPAGGAAELEALFKPSQSNLGYHEKIQLAFDAARGPNVPFLKHRLASFARRQDALLVAGMPFATINWGRLLPGNSPPVYLVPFRHGNDSYYDWDSYRESMRRSAGVLTLTDRELEDLPVEIRSKGTVIGGGADFPVRTVWPEPSVRAAARRSLGLPETGLLVLCLGRKTPSKGYRLLAEGVALAAARGGDVRLVMAGPDEDGLPVPGGPVTYLGKVSDADRTKLFVACDALGFFSQSESFGLVMIEAWAGGCLVLAGDRSPAAAAVAERLGAAKCRSTSEDIATALLRLGEMREVERRALWTAGLDVLTADFTWNKVAQRVLSALA